MGTVDSSLPQSWFDKVLSATGINPFGHIVWCYDDTPDGPSFGGWPRSIDATGDYILAVLAGQAIHALAINAATPYAARVDREIV